MSQMSRLLLDGKSDSKGLEGAETSYLGIAKDRWGGGRDQGPRGLVGAGEKMVTSLPSPADTGSGSSSRSHFPSLEAFRTNLRL